MQIPNRGEFTHILVYLEYHDYYFPKNTILLLWVVLKVEMWHDTTAKCVSSAHKVAGWGCRRDHRDCACWGKSNNKVLNKHL